MNEPLLFKARLNFGLVIHLDWLIKGVASAALLYFRMFLLKFQESHDESKAFGNA